MQIFFYITNIIVLKSPLLPPPPWDKVAEDVKGKLPQRWKLVLKYIAIGDGIFTFIT
jgi:hypothetical protein